MDSRYKVLITGGAGFIGSHLADRFLEDACAVTVLDNFDDFYSDKELNVAHNLGKQGYRLVRGDILDFEMVNSLTKNVDIVIHSAAQPGIQRGILDPMRAHHVNVTGTLNVLIAAKENSVGKVVYASSSAVYGVTDYLSMREDQPTSPTSPYGATKLAAEKYCLAFHTTYEMPITCLRYFSAYGPRGRPDQPVRKFTNKIIEGGRPTIYGDGSQTRDFTYISDVIDATYLAAISAASDGEIINIGYGSEIPIGVVAQKIISRLGKDVEPEYCAGYDGDFPRTLADNTKAKKILGWKPRVGFDEGLDRFLEWYMEAKVPKPRVGY